MLSPPCQGSAYTNRSYNGQYRAHRRSKTSSKQEHNDGKQSQDQSAVLPVDEYGCPDHDEKAGERCQDTRYKEVGDKCESWFPPLLPEPLGWTNGVYYFSVWCMIALKHFREAMAHSHQSREDTDA